LVAAVCSALCIGCGRDNAAGYREYSGNGKSPEHLIVKDGAASEAGESAENVAGEKTANAKSGATSARQVPAADASGAAAVEVVAQQPERVPNTSAASRPAGTAAAMLELPAVAIKPVPAQPAPPTVPGTGQAAIAASPVPREPKVLVKERHFQVVGPDEAIRISYDDLDLLRVLNMEPVTPDALSLMPDWLKGLEGKRVRLRGFMYPAHSQTDLAGFGYARDNDICCFVRKPKWYDVFPVQLRDGVTTDYVAGRPIDVVGVFHFLPDPEDWPVHGMYFIDDATVIDK
jgi:hypothetical protein